MEKISIAKGKGFVEVSSEMNRSEGLTKKDTSRIRKVTLLCPSCGWHETINLSDKTRLENIFYCATCKTLITMFDQKKNFLMRRLPIPEDGIITEPGIYY